MAEILPCRPPLLCSRHGCGCTSFRLDLDSHGPFLRVYDVDGHSLKALPWWICTLCEMPYFYEHWRQDAEDLRVVTRISGEEAVLLVLNGVAGDYVLGSLSAPEILYALALFERMELFRVHGGRRAGAVTAFLAMYNAGCPETPIEAHSFARANELVRRAQFVSKTAAKEFRPPGAPPVSCPMCALACLPASPDTPFGHDNVDEPPISDPRATTASLFAAAEAVRSEAVRAVDALRASMLVLNSDDANAVIPKFALSLLSLDHLEAMGVWPEDEAAARTALRPYVEAKVTAELAFRVAGDSTAASDAMKKCDVAIEAYVTACIAQRLLLRSALPDAAAPLPRGDDAVERAWRAAREAITQLPGLQAAVKNISGVCIRGVSHPYVVSHIMDACFQIVVDGTSGTTQTEADKRRGKTDHYYELPTGLKDMYGQYGSLRMVMAPMSHAHAVISELFDKNDDVVRARGVV